LDFDSNSDFKNDEENIDRGYPSRQEVKREREASRSNRRFKEKTDKEEGYSPARSKSGSSKKKINVKIPRVNLVLKVLAVVAVVLNIRFILNFMKEPGSMFYHTLFVLGICVTINFAAVWILFHKSSFMRFYLSLFAILGSFGYYIYVNYTNMTFLGNNLITSVLVGITVLMAINPKVNYYLKSFVFLLVPIIGIYLSGNRFALVWTLMFNAGLILFFRVSRSNKKEEKMRRNQQESA
jgi:hypothetical protein